MIKVVSLVSLIIAPVIVQYKALSPTLIIVVLVLLAGVAWAVWTSKREVDYGVEVQAAPSGVTAR
ncbi:MAG TPA: hypothetical protein EYH31_05010 [Anaerolineae bacterium]|nr:hypothetical protein [Anaerolineae bacterium]